MENYMKEDRTGVKITAPICDRLAAPELTCDLSLPDYLPEIKRLLRVKAIVLPPERYVGTGNADFSGTVRYTVLYAGNDGQLYSTAENSEYHFSVPVEATPDFEWNEGVVSDCEVGAEYTVGRVIAPRKLSVKCRLKAHVRLYGKLFLSETVTGADRKSVQRLFGHCDAAEFFSGVGEPLHLADEVLCDAKEGDLRVVLAEGQVFVTEACAGSQSVNCRGEVAIKLLLASDTSPTVQTVVRRIPFTQDVPTDGVAVNCEAVATGCCSDIQVSVEDNRILCELEIILQTRAQRNVQLTFTRDLYSTESECESKYAAVAIPRAIRCASGNISLNTTLPLSEIGLRPGLSLIDLSITPTVNALENEGGKYVLTGRARCQATLGERDEELMHEFEIPFRYECEGNREPVKDWSATAEIISSRGRLDSERIGVDAELAITLTTRTESEVRLLREAHFASPIGKCRSVYTICYPARTDTLWSVAKRYHRSVDTVAAANGLSDAPHADSPESLSGVKYLLV